MSAQTDDTALGAPVEWNVDELARRAGLPVRTIREYQTLGVLPPPGGAAGSGSTAPHTWCGSS